MKKQAKKSHFGEYFLCVVALVYLGLAFWDSRIFFDSLQESWKMMLKIAPAMLVVLFFMILLNYLVRPQAIRKYLGKGTGIKGYLLAIAGGVFSHGPIFVWYPFLKDMKDEGMSSGLIAVFLYSRAIKIPLLPLMVTYFGIGFTLLLAFYVLLASFCAGIFMDKIEKYNPP
ncbi:permease [bacterium]|nr:permease [bacterium]